jgi:hypothetical protein
MHSTASFKTPKLRSGGWMRPMANESLRNLVLTLSPSARDKLRTVLVPDQADRDAIATELLRYGTPTGTGGPA